MSSASQSSSSEKNPRAKHLLSGLTAADTISDADFIATPNWEQKSLAGELGSTVVEASGSFIGTSSSFGNNPSAKLPSLPTAADGISDYVIEIIEPEKQSSPHGSFGSWLSPYFEDSDAIEITESEKQSLPQNFSSLAVEGSSSCVGTSSSSFKKNPRTKHPSQPTAADAISDSDVIEITGREKQSLPRQFLSLSVEGRGSFVGTTSGEEQRVRKRVKYESEFSLPNLFLQKEEELLLQKEEELAIKEWTRKMMTAREELLKIKHDPLKEHIDLQKDKTKSPEVSDNVLPDMFFEFGSFPENLKRCLLHCLLFPVGYEFERDTLVQLWIAEELIEGEETDRMEDKGDDFFETLACNEYIVPSRFDKACGQLKYKVNESKLSTWYLDRGSSPGNFVSTNASELNDISDMTLHLSLSYEKFDLQTFEALWRFKNLRSLLLLGHFGCSIKQVPRDLFLSLKFLRTLNLSGMEISELPSSIGNLESLRYFDLSFTLINKLPELLCSLHNLQTLKLRDCFALVALPKGMSKLMNLRHLDFDIVRQLSSVPKMMGKLVNLRTLKGFIVGTDDGCGIGELSHMSNITGSFCISRLENVSTPEEAKKADLKSKKYLTKLELRWKECINAESEMEILECLVPHTGLKELQIQFYSGSALPIWICDPSFSNITSITLYKCVNCLFLPPFGDLPSLEFLTIVGMEKVRKINSLFCRTDDHRNQGYCAFPMLERLILDDLLNLEEWMGVENGDFPRLLRLCIRYCPKLSILPSMYHFNRLKDMELSHCSELRFFQGGLPTSLESLIIQHCPKLKERCRKDGGEDWATIAHVPSVWIDRHEISAT